MLGKEDELVQIAKDGQDEDIHGDDTSLNRHAAHRLPVESDTVRDFFQGVFVNIPSGNVGANWET